MVNRRQLMSGASLGLVSCGLAASSPVLAQSVPGNLLRRLGLPTTVNEIVRTVEAIAGLEQEARRLRLPESRLPVLANAAVPVDQAGLYRLALPRLVALIDRAEATQPALADRAGELLARLHSGQHEVPMAWRTTGQSADQAGPGALAIDDLGQPELPSPVITPQIDLPEAGPVVLPRVSPPTTLRARDFVTLRQEYEAMFAAAQILPHRRPAVEWCLSLMRTARGRYEAVASTTDVPWHFIAAIHGLEASFNFRAHLHNGDFPLTTRTRQVPAGRPPVWLPPSGWEASASDALRLMGFAGQQDWSLARTLHRLEAYNGFGYRVRGAPSPYLWSFSDQYDRGKFVADGRWDSLARSQQCGAAVMIKAAVEAGDIDIG